MFIWSTYILAGHIVQAHARPEMRRNSVSAGAEEATYVYLYLMMASTASGG